VGTRISDTYYCKSGSCDVRAKNLAAAISIRRKDRGRRGPLVTLFEGGQCQILSCAGEFERLLLIFGHGE